MGRWAELESGSHRRNHKIGGGILRKTFIVGAALKDIDDMTPQLDLNPNKSPEDIRKMIRGFGSAHKLPIRKGSLRHNGY